MINGTMYVYVTADRVTPESAAEGMAEESGWVDWDYSSRTVCESRNDVSPLFVAPYHGALSDDDADELRYCLSGISPSWEGENGTYYASDSDIDYLTGDSYRYAVHAFVKYYTPSGYVETPVSLPNL